MTDQMLITETNPAETVVPLTEVCNITKRFPGVLALNDVSVKFYPGEVHAVVGENGAGKSTLMKIMSGAYIPDSGEIYFDGKKVSFTHPQEALDAGISIIYQEFNLLPERYGSSEYLPRTGDCQVRGHRPGGAEQTRQRSAERDRRGKNDLPDRPGKHTLGRRAAAG